MPKSSAWMPQQLSGQVTLCITACSQDTQFASVRLSVAAHQAASVIRHSLKSLLTSVHVSLVKQSFEPSLVLHPVGA